MPRLARLPDGGVKVFLPASSNTRATGSGGPGGKVKEGGSGQGVFNRNGGQRWKRGIEVSTKGHEELLGTGKTLERAQEGSSKGRRLQRGPCRVFFPRPFP